MRLIQILVPARTLDEAKRVADRVGAKEFVPITTEEQLRGIEPGRVVFLRSGYTTPDLAMACEFFTQLGAVVLHVPLKEME